jgi:hypothetical protein
MNVDPGSPTDGPVFSSEPDPDRPSVPAAVAAKYFQKSRYYLTELIRQGEIEGYGIQKEKDGRTRWFVYEDAIPREPDSENGDPGSYWQRLLVHVLDARELSRSGREARAHAGELLLDVVSVMSEVAQAASEGEVSLMNKLLRRALVTHSEGVRQQIKADEFERKAEACLDRALRSFQPAMDNSYQYTRGDTGLISSSDVTA